MLLEPRNKKSSVKARLSYEYYNSEEDESLNGTSKRGQQKKATEGNE